MRDAGLYGEALTDWTTGGVGASGVLLGFTNIDTRMTAERLARRVLDLL
jgi:GntR family transcriptional regulator/MocR family aminotransferase